jgi:hypothetical protein
MDQDMEVLLTIVNIINIIPLKTVRFCFSDLPYNRLQASGYSVHKNVDRLT